MQPQIFAPVKDALQAMITGFLDGSNADGKAVSNTGHQPLLGELVTAFSQMDSFEVKLASVDAAFDANPTFEPIREFCFDLLMVNFFASDSVRLGADYLESAEWAEIEDGILDRGTELLNLLLYINECQEADAELSLDDFLKEFLLTDDDLYQDEHVIYEPIIKNQNLVDGEVKDIVESAAQVDDEDIQEIYVPLMVFFNVADEYEERYQQLLKYSHNKATDVAILAGIQTFAESLGEDIEDE